MASLVDQAFEARKPSYSPYSNFAVGAALKASNGEVFLGCNIENAALSPTNCAERTAIFKAVSAGITDFESIAVVGGDSDIERPLDFCPPCGVCRQVLREFCDPKAFKLIFPDREMLLDELLPHSFGPEFLSA